MGKKRNTLMINLNCHISIDKAGAAMNDLSSDAN